MKTMMCLGVSVIDKKYLYSKNIQDMAMCEAAFATREAYGDCYGYAAEDFEHDSYRFMLNVRLMRLFGIDFNWNRIEKAVQESEDFWNQTLYHDLESESMITPDEIDDDKVMTAEELAEEKAAYKAAYGVEYDEMWFEA